MKLGFGMIACNLALTVFLCPWLICILQTLITAFQGQNRVTLQTDVAYRSLSASCAYVYVKLLAQSHIWSDSSTAVCCHCVTDTKMFL